VKRAAIAAALGAALLVAAGAWGLSSLLKGPPATIAQFGYIRSLTPSGKTYVLRLDPALWLEGLTARQAAKEDGQEALDYYIRNAERSTLTYRVPANVPVTVVTVNGGVRSTRITVAELAQIAKGKNPKHRPLIERGSARYLGYWVRTKSDAVTSIDQQYQP
jgi:hypothetical protein